MIFSENRFPLFRIMLYRAFRFSSILSQISAAMSAPPKFLTERMPVGEVMQFAARELKAI
jgi:hypothetical protein